MTGSVARRAMSEGHRRGNAAPITGLIFALVATGAVAASAGQGTARPLDSPHSTLAIIVNTQNTIDELPVDGLRRILLGETTRWPDGRRITVAMRDTGQAERDAMLRIVCGMSDQDFIRYLLQATFRGTLQTSPKILDTPNGVRRFVFNVPGAIGYVRGDEVDGSIKMLRITGTLSERHAFGLTLPIR